MLFSRLLTLAFTGITATATPTPANDNKGKNNNTAVTKIDCNGQEYAYQRLAGFGSVPSNARDKYGDTLGGFGSAIAWDQKSWKKGKDETYTGTLYALPDRGWNTNGTLNYQNRIQKFAVTFKPDPQATVAQPSGPNVNLNLVDTILLTGPDGTPTTGLDADVTGSITYPGFPKLPVATYKGNGFGGAGPGGKRISVDSEGLIFAPDGTFWVSDEYGPYIYHFSKTGKMLSATAPPDAIIPHRNGTLSFSADSPPIYDPNEVINPANPQSGRANNQGLEGLTLSADGKTLSVLLQSACDQEGGPGDASRKQARFLQYDVQGDDLKYKHEYVVTLPLYTTAKGKPKVAAQSEIHATVDDSQYFVLSRDSGAGLGQSSAQSIYRHVDVFDISSATDLKFSSNDGVGDAIADSNGNLNAGIKPAEYCPFLDFNDNSQLNRFGVRNGGAQSAGLLDEKWESLALVPVDDAIAGGKRDGKGKDREYFLWSVSDNDFITQDGYMNFGQFPYKDASGADVETQVLVFRVRLPKGVKATS